MSQTRLILVALASMLAAATIVQAQNAVRIRLATVVPANSEWDKALREMADTVRRGTQDRVMTQVFPGGSQGSEKAVVESMMATGGAVNAALMTAPGLAQIDDAFNVFAIPFFLESDAEARHVRGKLTPLLEKRLDAKGFHLLAWGEGGWVQLFSQRPIKTLADLKKARLYTSEGNDKMVQWYRSNGFNPMALPESEIIKQLKTLNSLEVVPIPPYPAQLMAIFRDAPNMLELQVAPLVGAAVVSNAAWGRLSETDRKSLVDAAKAMESRIAANVRKLDLEAVAAMQREGYDLKVHKLDSKAASEFRAEANKMTSAMSGSMVPKDVFDLALRERDAYRKTANPQR